MKTLISQYTLLAALMAMVFPLTLQAQTGDCAGEWQLTVEQSKANYIRHDPLAVWIPAKVQMSAETARCAGSVVLSGELNRPVTINARGMRQQVYLFDKQKRPLADTHLGRGKQLFLDASGITDFWLRIPQVEQMVPGMYSGVLNGRLNRASTDNLQENSMIYFAVTPVVDLQLAGQCDGGRNDYCVLDFGQLVAGKQKQLELLIRSNASVDLTFESKNQGMLQRRHGNGQVPYSMKFAQHPLDLKNRAVHTLDARHRGAGLYPMTVRIGQIQDVPAGRYSEEITITAKAR